MANRRKFLAGIGALASGSAAAMGTGAFTSVSANRNLSVKTADDTNALLGIREVSGAGNAQYVETTDGGVSIDISSSNGGDGVNADAETFIDNLFKIENQGTQDVYIWSAGLPNGFDLFVQNGASGSKFKNNGEVTDGAAPNRGAFNDESSINVPENPSGDGTSSGLEGAPLLGPGDSVVIQGYSDGSNTDLDSSSDITIKAVAQSEA